MVAKQQQKRQSLAKVAHTLHGIKVKSQGIVAAHKMTAICKVFLGVQSINLSILLVQTMSIAVESAHCLYIVFIVIYEARLMLEPIAK